MTGTSQTPAENAEKQDSSHQNLEEREKWSNKIEFLLGCVAFSVGLGNVWRFPYLCYRDGGGAFLVPYFICVLLGGIPVFMLEVALGQYTSQGVITCWNLIPLFKGIGYASCLIIFYCNIYYNMIMGWAFYYLFSSFTTKLPWAGCGNEWNTDYCREEAHTYKSLNQTLKSYILADYSDHGVPDAYGQISANNSYYEEVRMALGRNITLIDLKMLNGTAMAVDPVTEFWENKVLALSDGIENIGTLKWDLVLCLLLAWIVVFFCIWKGIKWSGKIMYVTTTSPYILMFILLIRAVTLPGAIHGIKYYLYPDLSKLSNARVWYGAASQVFYSYSLCVGALTALGSYNQFNHNFLKDSVMFALINSGTSFLAGFVIFAILGFMSHQQQVSVDMVAESGPGLAFIAYPKAVAELPGAPIWAVLFFIMLILLGMDSQFGCVEGFVTAIIDNNPEYLRRKWGREIFVAILCVISFFIGLPMATNGGMYIFQIFDYYSQARIVLVIGIFECIAVAWVYGADRFYSNIELMLGQKIRPHLKICWKFITPLFITVMSVMCFYHYSDVSYNRTYHYPMWALPFGWFLSFSSVGLIPIVMVYKIIRAKGSFIERIRFLSKPQIEIPKGKILAGEEEVIGGPQVTLNLLDVEEKSKTFV